jgi:hypothetical protein
MGSGKGGSMMICECCAQELKTYTQESLYPGSAKREYGECKNQQCEEYDVTLLIVDGRLCNPERLYNTEGA